MRRRRYLKAIGTGTTISIVGLAGCSEPEGGTETDAQGGGGETTTTTTTETATASTPTSTESTSTSTGSTSSQQVPNEVAMKTADSEFLFDPVGLYVEPGETITWINESGSHSTTAYTKNNPQSEVSRVPKDAEGWNSDILDEQGAEFTHTFEVEGTYDYYCIPHKSTGMVARLVVGEPSGLEDDPPDGPVPSEQTIVDKGVVTQDEFNP